MATIRKLLSHQLDDLLRLGKAEAPYLQSCLKLNKSNDISLDKKQSTLLAYRIKAADMKNTFGFSKKHTTDLFHILQTNKQNFNFPITDVKLITTDAQTELQIYIDAKSLSEEVIHSIMTNTWRYMFGGPLSNGLFSQPHMNMVVEYSSPNIAKPFHAGHLRSTIIGHFLSNLLEEFGHDVTRVNYLGDWGTQFGLLLAMWDKHGDDRKLEENPIRHLFELYVRGNTLAEGDEEFAGKCKSTFTSLENGDEKLRARHAQFRDVSVKEYGQVYDSLGIRFNQYESESQYAGDGKKIVRELLQAGIVYRDEEEGVVKYQQQSKAKLNLPLLKKDGSTLYISRDLAAIVDRSRRYKFDRMYYVVDFKQEQYFSGLFELACKGGLISVGKQELVHVKFGQVNGMSSRKGEVIFLQDILDEGRRRMLAILRQKHSTRIHDSGSEEYVCDVLSRSALYIQDLKSRISRSYSFDWDRMLSNDQDTGVSLQYTHARLGSLLSALSSSQSGDIDVSPLIHNEDACLLILHIARCDEVMRECVLQYEPCVLVQFLFRLSHLVNRCYARYRVVDMQGTDAQSWLHLYDCSRKCLEAGLNVLGLPALKQI